MTTSGETSQNEAAPNGHQAMLHSVAGDVPAGLRAKPKTSLQALGELPLAQLAGLITDIIKTAVAQVPARNGLQCATCSLNRAAWWHANQPAIAEAHAAACADSGIEPGTPQAAAIDLVNFLPARLQPGTEHGLPMVYDVTVIAQGTGYCPVHQPGTPQAQQHGRLIAVPGISVHAAAQLAMAGTPGMPGVPG